MANTALRIAALRRRLRASRVLGATAALLALAALLAVGPADRGVARVHGVARVADVDRVERAATARPAVRFGTPGYYLRVKGDAFFNTVGPGGDILATSDDSRGVNGVCRYSGGGDIVLVRARGSSAQRLQLSTVNCLTDYGPLGGIAIQFV